MNWFRDLLFIGLVTIAHASTGVSEDLQAHKTADGAGKNWGVILDARHFMPMDPDLDQSTLFNLVYGYDFNDTHSLFILQEIQKLYDIPQNDDEVIWSDTVMGYTYALRNIKNTKTRGITGSIGTILPVSEDSRNNSVQGGLIFTASWTEVFLEKLTVALNPSGVFMLNEYTTTPTSVGNNGGKLLPQYVAGGELKIKYKLLNFLALSASGKYQEVAYEKLEKANSGSQAMSHPTDHVYAYTAGLDILLAPTMKVKFGYSHKDVMEQLGNIKAVAYDERKSKIYAGAEYAF